MRDEHAIVLDFLPRGRSEFRKPEPIAQVLGEKFFSLLEVVIKKDVTVKQGDMLYIGDDERKEVDHIKRRVRPHDLTTFAKSELPFVVERVVKEHPERFVAIFNTSQPVSTRLHQLELLPGIGKKHMWDIIKERKKGPFKNFKDLQHRVKLLPDPQGMIIKRIIEELEDGHVRYRLFVAGPPRRY